jgi:hypothetical protein
MQLIKYESEVFLVLSYRITKHEYIIKIYMYKSSNELSEDCYHEPLECSWSITVSLLHCMAQKGAIYSGKCDFPHVCRLYMYLFVCV